MQHKMKVQKSNEEPIPSIPEHTDTLRRSNSDTSLREVPDLEASLNDVISYYKNKVQFLRIF
jgi:hypothetical protein